jgi:integrase
MARNQLNFTKASIESLPLPAANQRIVYYDTRVEGLQLRISGRGTKSFCVYRWLSSEAKPERVTIGKYPYISIEQARAKATEINAMIAQGKNPNAPMREVKAEMTLQELFQLYIDRWAKPRKKTWQEDIDKFKRYLLTGNALGKKRLSQITRNDIALLHAAIGTRRPITANRVLALISSIYGRAMEWGLWEKANPAQGIRKFPERSRDRFIQSDELPRFFVALAQEPNEMLQDYFMLLLLTGVRRSNLMAMRWDEINFERMEWRIPDTKNGTPQVVSLDDGKGIAINILNNRKAKTNSLWVFPGTGKSGHLAEPRKGWERILARAGIKDLRIHDLRRTLGSWMAGTGASTVMIGRQLNQKSEAATRVYARLALDPVKEARNKALKAIFDTANLFNK